MGTKFYKINSEDSDPLDSYLHFKDVYENKLVDETEDVGIFNFGRVAIVAHRNKNKVLMMGYDNHFDITEKEIKLSGFDLEKIVDPMQVAFVSRSIF